MARSKCTRAPEGAMAPICEAIDAVLRGLTIRIGNDVIREVETVVTVDGIVARRSKELKKFDIDELLNGRYEGNTFYGWDPLIKTGIKEFSIVDMKKFKIVEAKETESDEDYDDEE